MPFVVRVNAADRDKAPCLGERVGRQRRYKRPDGPVGYRKKDDRADRNADDDQGGLHAVSSRLLDEVMLLSRIGFQPRPWPAVRKTYLKLA